MNIFVSGLSFNTTDEGLTQLFATYGTVTSAKVIMDKYTNRSKGFGFVEMSDDNEAQRAMKELDGCLVDGRSIKVNEARPREDRSGRSNFSGGRRSSNNRW